MCSAAGLCQRVGGAAWKAFGKRLRNVMCWIMTMTMRRLILTKVAERGIGLNKRVTRVTMFWIYRVLINMYARELTSRRNIDSERLV